MNLTERSSIGNPQCNRTNAKNNSSWVCSDLDLPYVLDSVVKSIFVAESQSIGSKILFCAISFLNILFRVSSLKVHFRFQQLYQDSHLHCFFSISPKLFLDFFLIKHYWFNSLFKELNTNNHYWFNSLLKELNKELNTIGSILCSYNVPLVGTFFHMCFSHHQNALSKHDGQKVECFSCISYATTFF